jgi:hypothetical protein
VAKSDRAFEEQASALVTALDGFDRLERDWSDTTLSEASVKLRRAVFALSAVCVLLMGGLQPDEVRTLGIVVDDRSKTLVYGLLLAALVYQTASLFLRMTTDRRGEARRVINLRDALNNLERDIKNAENVARAGEAEDVSEKARELLADKIRLAKETLGQRRRFVRFWRPVRTFLDYELAPWLGTMVAAAFFRFILL